MHTSRYYNILDITAMLEGIEKMADYFRSRGLDLGKAGISLPGLAMKDLMSNIDTFFSLTAPQDRDIYELMRSKGIVGG